MALPTMDKGISLHIDPTFQFHGKVVSGPDPFSKFSRRSRSPNNAKEHKNSQSNFKGTTMTFSQDKADALSKRKRLEGPRSEEAKFRPQVKPHVEAEKKDDSYKHHKRCFQDKLFKETEERSDQFVLPNGNVYCGGKHVSGLPESCLFGSASDEPVPPERFGLRSQDEIRARQRFQHWSMKNGESAGQVVKSPHNRFADKKYSKTLDGVLHPNPSPSRGQHKMNLPWATGEPVKVEPKGHKPNVPWAIGTPEPSVPRQNQGGYKTQVPWGTSC